ncbi:hypothetical protein Mapa_012874 [Marchantia paleacea]|nr:hypothetical protein Mapa_012874 [Marchantia paleacea]
MPSMRGFLRRTMCLVKRKPSGRDTESKHGSNREVRAYSARSTSKVTQHDSSSSEFTGGSGYTPSHSHSRESQNSTGSAASKSSLATLKEVVGEGVHIFQYKELRRATEGFSSRRKIGNSVYRGTVRGVEVAITRHKKAEMFTDLVSEVKSLCSIHHTNVVSMIGAAAPDEDEHVYAVYEFMEGGAKLRDCLRNPHSPGYCALGTWIQRLQVALDVARGLEYLHNSTHKSLIHKYVKSNNVLVDGTSLRAKIANFGVAHLAGEFALAEEQEQHSQQLLKEQEIETLAALRMCSGIDTEIIEIIEDEPLKPRMPSTPSTPSTPTTPGRPRLSRSRSRKLTGTRGYMAPEYISKGAVTTKTDVFAYGVVLLEILSGQEPITFKPDPSSGVNVVKRITLHETIQAIFLDPEPKAKLRRWIDPLLNDSYPLDYALKAARLAKSCVEANPLERPEMRTITLELSKIMMSSERWEAGMVASKNLMSRTMEAR